MAPILATATGISPQVLDDPVLQQLWQDLEALEITSDGDPPPFVQELTKLLEPVREWGFEEQIDLHHWIHALNAMDAALHWTLSKYPQQLLVAPVSGDQKDVDKKEDVVVAESMQDVESVPTWVFERQRLWLTVLSHMLNNATSKSIFGFAPELADLLGSADDEVADLALTCLQALAVPPALHKQQQPEMSNSHSIPLQKCTSRLVSLARGWGTRGMGLGLYQAVVADDATDLPSAGQVLFTYYREDDKESTEENHMVEISIDESEMLLNNEEATTTATTGSEDAASVDGDETSAKRRRLGSAQKKKKNRQEVKSTPELFFLALNKAGGRKQNPPERLFSLLADIRLARSFHSQSMRQKAVERRLRALVAILHGHPSQEIMSGYFQAQPELCVEIVDLLRPTVSAANVSASKAVSKQQGDAITGLVSSEQAVPYSVRMLSLEALTALVSRRDGSTGALSGSARLSSVLTELGVGKGQYLGLLPTLIRYSLASLGSVVVASSEGGEKRIVDVSMEVEPESKAFDIGLAFVEATAAPEPPRMVQVLRALAFIDNVLTLTSAVVSSPTGTSALTDCGLIPALLTMVRIDTETIVKGLFADAEADYSPSDLQRVRALLSFVTAQAVQILEAAIVTHNNALTAFHDLQGVEVLTTRLSREISSYTDPSGDGSTRSETVDAMDVDPPTQRVSEGEADMQLVDAPSDERRIRSSQRVLLFCIVTCLTVVFHQESTSSSVTTPSGGAQLRKKELTQAVIEILSNVSSYGGNLAALVATLLSDIMNSDPHVVHYVQSSGIAKAFIDMVLGKKVRTAGGNLEYEPILPPVPDLIMAVPNVISALSLTEAGAKAVFEANPFPSFLRIFYHPNYAMPKSRCLLNEMTAIVGTGLDEIMRHVERLKPLVLDAIADAMARVVTYSEDLSRREDAAFNAPVMTSPQPELEDERSCLIQYVLNFGQLLEQILHNEDHCDPFVNAGGLDALLRLLPASMPTGFQFLTGVSSLSSPSVSTLHHSTIEESLSLAFKCIEFRYDPLKLIRKMSETVTLHLDAVEESQRALFEREDACFVLDGFPSEPLYRITEPESVERTRALSTYLRNVATLQWCTGLLGTAIKAACQRSQESGTGWSRTEREWKKEISSESFEALVNRLSRFLRSSIFEVCRVRTKDEFEEREKERRVSRSKGLRYRLRIVCLEGAVVRDGIEIDSCASVGSMEMSEVVDSFDRCINSSGILRYRTRRGWVSEMTRGHGREPIAEVIGLWESDVDEGLEPDKSSPDRRRIEANLLDLRSVGTGVLARGQTCFTELFSALSRVVVQGVRSLPVRTVSFDQGTVGAHVASTMKMLTSSVMDGFNQEGIVACVNGSGSAINDAGAAMYLGCMLNQVYACLFDDKRERRMVNFPLLVSLLSWDSKGLENESAPEIAENQGAPNELLGLFGAARFVLGFALSDFNQRAMEITSSFMATDDNQVDKKPKQSVSRSTAASLPPLITLLRRLVSSPVVASPAASIMSRMKWKDVALLVGEKNIQKKFGGTETDDEFFKPELFANAVKFAVSRVTKETWLDSRFVHTPPFLAHPMASLVGDIIVALEDASKKKVSGDTTSTSRQDGRMLLSDYFRDRRREDEETETVDDEEFEPSEDAIAHLTEMGFSRDHALDALESTRSNRIEIAMEYALSHPPPSAETIARRQTEREDRARRREEQLNAQAAQEPQGEQDREAEGDASNESAVARESDAVETEATVAESEALDVKPPASSADTKDTPGKESEEVRKAKAELNSWIEDAPKVCGSVLDQVKLSGDPKLTGLEQQHENGDGDAEALTVVLCSFLLDLCHRYPESCSKMVSQVLELLMARIVPQDSENSSTYVVPEGSESSVAALCHAAVLFTRALPKTRVLVLQKGLVRALVSCIQGFLKSVTPQSGPPTWPLWLAPALLLLDIMSQPLVAFTVDELKTEGDELPDGADTEFAQVRDAHKAQVAGLSDMADKIFSGLPNHKKKDSAMTEKPNGASGEQSGTAAATAEKQDESNLHSDKKPSPFSSLPAYFPLIPSDLAEACLDICRRLLGINEAAGGKVVLPPGVTHATLLLLLRLLRTPRVSSQCLRTGVAEAILGLTGESKFTGNEGLVTLVFRRLLEDESTLQTAMETEIRSTVIKLHAKQKGPAVAKTETPSITIRSFIEAVTPLLCRDPVSFLKATALTVNVEPGSSKDSTETKVSLLSQDERSRNASSLSDLFSSLTDGSSKSEGHHSSPRQRRKSSSSNKSKSSHHQNHQKGNRRSSLSKKTKKEKSDSPKTVQETPTAHVTCLLLNRIIISIGSDATKDQGDRFVENKMFLWTGNLLDILADLVLAVPACASAVHNYRPHRSKDKAARAISNSLVHHALSGCPAPPKTFVSFLLHSILPQDRWSIRNDPQIWERRKGDGSPEAEIVTVKKDRAYRLTHVSQSAARVLVALVVRPGEGRKRVIADLTYALSGGHLGHGSVAPQQNEGSAMNAYELHALQAWGELCQGLAAPGSSGKNLDGSATLSFENIRLMLENGMAHALLYAMHRVRLFHPMASSTYAALLLPFEILTRSNVTRAVKSITEKEAEETATKAGSKSQMDGSDQPMVDAGAHFEAFGGDAAQARAADGDVESDDHDMDEDADEGSEDEEISSEEESEGSSDEESEDESDMDDDDDDEASDMEDSEEMSIEVEDEGDWNVDYNDAFRGENQGEMQEFDDAEEDGTERAEQQALDEGWTRIESSGFGGMLLGGRRNTGLPSNAGDRARGFVDAAEAMIGTLLRTGEISGEALAEIEGTLGIRIMANNRSLRGTLASQGGMGRGDPLTVPTRGAAAVGNAQGEATRRGEVIGTLPHIHQRSQPDVGYSAFGTGGRWIEISSMEYVYGGPSVTAANRNYDLISPVQTNSNATLHPSVSQLDLQLFPGGPASAASARTRHALHPLLCGVDLPPVNSLVSDLLPHGERATRRGQMTTRAPGDWTDASFSTGGYLVSTSNGNIIRSNRSHSGAPLGNGLSGRPVAPPVGWTDDGLPFDATVQDFSSAFERAICESTRQSEHSDQVEGATSDGRDAENGETIAAASNQDSVAANQSSDGRGSNTAASDELPAVDVSSLRDQPSGPVQNDEDAERSPENGSDGERVASSLAASLRLSPRSETSANSDRMSAANDGNDAVPSHEADASLADSPMDDAAGPAYESSPTEARSEPGTAPEATQPEATATDGGQVGSDRSEPAPEQGDSADDRPAGDSGPQGEPNANGLVCPPDIDLEVFNSLPLEMQQDCVDQYNATRDLAAQLDGSTLDPEVLAALPEDMRREVIEQDRRERQLREQQEQAPADPSHAEEMDNASFIASLAPELREEILLTADDAFLNSLPPNIIAEAQILRERAASQHRAAYDGSIADALNGDEGQSGGVPLRATQANENAETGAASSSRRKHRSGKLRVEIDRPNVVFVPQSLSDPIAMCDIKALVRLVFLLSPVRPSRLLQKVFQNLCVNPSLRKVLSTAFVKLLHEDGRGASAAVEVIGKGYAESDEWRRSMDKLFNDEGEFPPSTLLGAAPEVPESEAYNMSISLLRRKQGSGTAASAAASLPTSAGGSRNDSCLPPVVAARLVDTLLQLCKSSSRFSLHILASPVLEDDLNEGQETCFEKLLDLLIQPMYAKSAANLEQLLTLLESATSPLSHLPKHGGEDIELSQRDIDTAAAAGKEWADAPRVTISQPRLQLLCSTLRMEACRDYSFAKVNTIVRRLCRVETNRGYVLAELGSVAHALGADAIRDLKALRIRMDDAVTQYQIQLSRTSEPAHEEDGTPTKRGLGLAGTFSSTVTLSTSTSELKLLRVLQTLQALCGDSTDESSSKKNEGSVIVTEELVHLLRQMQFDDLWDELSACLKIVQVLEGVSNIEDVEENSADEAENNDETSDENNGGRAKKLRNSSAGLLTRFLPVVEAFFVANASATRPKEKSSAKEEEDNMHLEIGLDNLVGGKRLMDFVVTNKVLLNALIRNSPGLLDKGLRALVQVPRCRVFLDFDVKRQWFKTQVRRLRQHASRRHGSLRLHIRRKYVFEDAYHQLRLRNADEMRGRLHITFRNEEGVDAGGLSREFFAILAKEIFNPNYALFTSTEDGCTFQPNPNSSINPDHLSYFRFVGRIVGKAVADGFLLDAHFTRSLYKHMLGMTPTHHDMEAIDPDYYKNLQTILEYNLADIGLDLTFSIDDHCFGRNQVIDLVPNGRTVLVTEENKEEYVRLVCQHRMTTAISSQIKAYLDGFHELVSTELIAIFTPRELELLISGLPDIDVHDLKKNTDYVGWKATDNEIQWFWNVMFSLSRNEKAAFLQFVTGSSKVPLAGFSELQGMRGTQKFSIHKAGGSKGALMSAHTCFNSLDLPPYNSEEEMREKLLYAINEGGGGFLFA